MLGSLQAGEALAGTCGVNWACQDAGGSKHSLSPCPLSSCALPAAEKLDFSCSPELFYSRR